MLSQACVKNSVPRVVSTSGSLEGCLPLGPHPLGRHPPRQTPLQGRYPLGIHPHETATAADGTHPTGMQSCL